MEVSLETYKSNRTSFSINPRTAGMYETSFSRNRPVTWNNDLSKNTSIVEQFSPEKTRSIDKTSLWKHTITGASGTSLSRKVPNAWTKAF
jgi:hypothetical protein